MVKPNCISYCKDTGKCNNIKTYCPYKDDEHLICKSGGMCPEPEKDHNYRANRAGGHSFVDNASSKKGKI